MCIGIRCFLGANEVVAVSCSFIFYIIAEGKKLPRFFLLFLKVDRCFFNKFNIKILFFKN